MSGDQGSVDSMLMQCLAFSRDLESKNKSFKFNFSTTNFHFSMTTMEERKPSAIVKVKKKVSPSTLKRNARRKEEYIQKKVETADNEVISEKDTTQQNTSTPQKISDLKCEQCDRKFESSQGLQIRIGRAHKSELPPENLRSQKEDIAYSDTP